jgi:hypothetical protein
MLTRKKIILFTIGFLLLIISAFNCMTNESSHLKKHIIKSGIERDHGLTTAIGDLNGDGRTDALICWGWRNIAKDTDAVYWYKCPSDPRNAGEWQQYRITH